MDKKENNSVRKAGATNTAVSLDVVIPIYEAHTPGTYTLPAHISFKLPHTFDVSRYCDYAAQRWDTKKGPHSIADQLWCLTNPDAPKGSGAHLNGQNIAWVSPDQLLDTCRYDQSAEPMGTVIQMLIGLDFLGWDVFRRGKVTAQIDSQGAIGRLNAGQ